MSHKNLSIMKTAKQIILSETGFKSITALKKHLKSIAADKYGCMYAEIKNPSFKVYTLPIQIIFVNSVYQ